MLSVAGFQRRLLRQTQRFDRCWWSAMIILELDGQFAAAGVDVSSARGPASIQSRVDADDLPDRPLRGEAVLTRTKPAESNATR